MLNDNLHHRHTESVSFNTCGYTDDDFFTVSYWSWQFDYVVVHFSFIRLFLFPLCPYWWISFSFSSKPWKVVRCLSVQTLDVWPWFQVLALWVFDIAIKQSYQICFVAQYFLYHLQTCRNKVCITPNRNSPNCNSYQNRQLIGFILSFPSILTWLLLLIWVNIALIALSVCYECLFSLPFFSRYCCTGYQEYGHSLDCFLHQQAE